MQNDSIHFEKRDFVFNVSFLEQNGSKTKNKNDKCQRNLTCTDASHDINKTKKHVFVSHQHQENHDKKNLLEQYKSRCILKQTNLVQHSTGMKLSFQTDGLSAEKNVKEITENNAIYHIQNTELNEMQFLIFYDSKYNNFVSACDAIKRLDRHATQEWKGPITILVEYQPTLCMAYLPCQIATFLMVQKQLCLELVAIS